MTVAAPRLDDRLTAEIDRLGSSRMSPAEIRRELVVLARRLGLCPPSYEHVRRLVAQRRLGLEEAQRSSEILPLVVDVALGFEHGTELVRVARGEKRRRR